MLSKLQRNTLFDMIIQAYNAGYMTREEAIDAMKDILKGE